MSGSLVEEIMREVAHENATGQRQVTFEDIARLARQPAPELLALPGGP